MLQPHDRIDKRLPVRIVKMQRKVSILDTGARERFEQFLCARRRAHARRIGDRDFVDAHGEQVGGDLGDGVRVGLGAFVRATEGDGDVASDAQVARFGRGDQGLEAVEGFLDRAVGVGFGEGFGGGGEEGDFGGEGV